MSVYAGPEIVNDGLVLCLDAGNSRSYPGSGTIWTDLSRNGNNGTLVNGVGYTSGNSGSLVFDGSNDQVDVASSTSLNLINEITLTSWVRFLSSPSSTGNPNIIDKWNWPENKRSWFLGTEGGQLSARISEDGTYNNSAGIFAGAPTLNVWMNLSMTFKNKVLNFYQNGLLTQTTNSITDPSFSNLDTSVFIGRAVGTGSRWLNANIPQVQIYNRALTAAEIAQNFQALRGRFGI
jgi:hypothetical protein